MLRDLSAFAAIAVAAQTVLSTPAAEPLQQVGREATRLLLGGDARGLAAHLSPDFLTALGGEAGLGKFMETVRTQAGPERQILEEAAFVEAGLTSFYHRARFTKAPDVTIRWVMDAGGVIKAGSVRPTVQPAETAKGAYRARAQLRVPFAAPSQGRWYVAWGGNDAIHNYHVAAPDQRFALDLLILNGATMPFRGDGKRNEDHYCFGQPILAPAGGQVTEVVSDVPDNAAPGVQNAAQPAGNHVVIDHGNGEFSVLAHLKVGSVTVAKGQKVRGGVTIGRCGNSGKSTLPHLHYHLQNAPTFGSGIGLPARFHNVAGSGEARQLERGQYIESSRRSGSVR